MQVAVPILSLIHYTWLQKFEFVCKERQAAPTG